MVEFTDQEKRQFDDWTKMQVYEAYLTEREARIQTNENLNKMRRQKAEILYRIRELKKDCDEKYR